MLDLGKPTDEIDGWLKHVQLNFNPRFWDEKVGQYYDYDVRSGKQIPVNTAPTFLLLFAKILVNTAEPKSNTKTISRLRRDMG